MTSQNERQHVRWMERCLTLAAEGAGHVSPNPMVGSVIVGPHGELLGEGAHRKFGGPHAERNALQDAREKGNGAALPDATLYVNLEPCNHTGKTPPCTEAIIEHSIPRVVVGMEDPFPVVAGRGLDQLKEAGVQVDSGILEPQCQRLNEAFVHHVQTGRPLVTLKVAQTLDGQIATRTGHSRWISCVESRTLVHRWRSELDAVMVGGGTAQVDDPRLTVRHVDGRQPLRVVLDRQGLLDPHLQLFSDTFAHRTLAVVGENHPEPSYAQPLQDAGGRVVRIPETADDHIDLEALLEFLGGEGDSDHQPVQSVLVEAGAGLATALVEQDLVDRYFCFIAPKLIGQGIAVLGDLGFEKMSEALTFKEAQWQKVGSDLLFCGYMRPATG